MPAPHNGASDDQRDQSSSTLASDGELIAELTQQVAARLAESRPAIGPTSAWWSSLGAQTKAITGVVAVALVAVALVRYVDDKPSRADANIAEEERELNERRIDLLEQHYATVASAIGEIKADIGTLRSDVHAIATEVARARP